MPRPSKQPGSRRYFVTVSLATAERIDAYAASIGRRPTRVAGELLVAGLAIATGTVADDRLAAAQRRIEELERELRAVFQTQRPPEPTPKGPRWEWSVQRLLADGDWWERWLPRLYELLGRDLRELDEPGAPFESAAGRPPVDSRGYGDLMAYLFPPLQRGAREVTWRSDEYAELAAEAGREAFNEGVLPPARPHVWEPVLRHVAVALCALEQTGSEEADAQLRLETEERITGSWVRTLRALVGEPAVEQLPRPIR